MSKIYFNAEGDLLALGLSLIGTAMEVGLRANQPSSSDVLSAATTAYQQGKITKSQLMAVIDALDEQTYQTRAYTMPNTSKLARRWNYERSAN